MSEVYGQFTKAAAERLAKGEVGVIPTDTIYGVVGSALRSRAVERIYRMRKRTSSKPMIVLIASEEDLKKFGVMLNKFQTGIIKKCWPGPVSVILPCEGKNFFYLHRGGKSIAFRLPAKRQLRNFLADAGPLVAPSANFEGKKPSASCAEARRVFGEDADFYIDKGILNNPSSTILRLSVDGYEVVRKGAPIPKLFG